MNCQFLTSQSESRVEMPELFMEDQKKNNNINKFHIY